MFQKGDLIVYGNMGVCRVEAVEAPAGLPGAGEKKLYYKLDPVYETGTVYIPVDAKVFMRPILTHAQAEALIGRIPEIEENPCGGKDQQMLAEHYRSLMRTHDCDDLVQLIKTIYGKNRERTAQGKKPARTEAEYMKRAEELLHGELAAALGKETIDTYNTGESRGRETSHSLNYQKLGKELMSQDELAVMDGGKCILQLRGVRPFLSDKYDITKHPNYPYTADADPKNAFDIEAFLSTRLKLKPNEVYDVYEVDAEGV